MTKSQQSASHRARCGVIIDRFSGKEFDERLSELSAHGAVKDEVDGVVDKRRDVHDVTERRVQRRKIDRL